MCIGCGSKDSHPDQYQIYKWRAISFSDEVLGESDTTFISDTLFANHPANLDSTDQRFTLYKLPSELKSIEEIDTVITSSELEFIVYSNMVSELWYNDSYGFVWSVFPHARIQPFIWSYELSEIISFENGIIKVVNTDSLISSIQNYRYLKLEEMEKEFEH